MTAILNPAAVFGKRGRAMLLQFFGREPGNHTGARAHHRAGRDIEPSFEKGLKPYFVRAIMMGTNRNT